MIYNLVYLKRPYKICKSSNLGPRPPYFSRNIPSHTLVLLEPIFPLNLLQIRPPLRIFIKYFPNNFLQSLRKMSRKVAITADNLFVCDIFVFCFKGSLSSCQFVQQDTQGPNINSFIILTPFNNLWRDVVNSSAESLPLAE